MRVKSSREVLFAFTGDQRKPFDVKLQERVILSGGGHPFWPWLQTHLHFQVCGVAFATEEKQRLK